MAEAFKQSDVAKDVSAHFLHRRKEGKGELEIHGEEDDDDAATDLRLSVDDAATMMQPLNPTSTGRA